MVCFFHESFSKLHSNSHGFRILPYGVTVGALTIIFIIIELVLIAQRRLLPGVVLLFAFMLMVLFLAGAIGTGIQLFGGNNINNQCNTYVFNQRWRGVSERTLAFLQQQNICRSTHSRSTGK